MRRAVILMAVMGMALLLASGVALAATIKCNGGLCRGTPNDDHMTGTAGFDKMYGLAGRDAMYGRGDGDVMYGKGGNDTMLGETARDKMYGSSGSDIMFGGSGGDRINGGDHKDQIDAETGNDHVNIADGVQDSVSCGIGDDTLVHDQFDLVNQNPDDFTRSESCEHANRRLVVVN